MQTSGVGNFQHKIIHTLHPVNVKFIASENIWLTKAPRRNILRMGDQEPVYFFKAEEPEFGFLCQWYPSQFKDDNGQTYKNAEQSVHELPKL